MNNNIKKDKGIRQTFIEDIKRDINIKEAVKRIKDYENMENIEVNNNLINIFPHRGSVGTGRYCKRSIIEPFQNS